MCVGPARFGRERYSHRSQFRWERCQSELLNLIFIVSMELVQKLLWHCFLKIQNQKASKSHVYLWVKEQVIYIFWNFFFNLRAISPVPFWNFICMITPMKILGMFQLFRETHPPGWGWVYIRMCRAWRFRPILHIWREDEKLSLGVRWEDPAGGSRVPSESSGLAMGLSVALAVAFALLVRPASCGAVGLQSWAFL